MNCDGFIRVDFASYLVVDNTINVKNYDNSNDIPVSISVNTDNLHLCKVQETYTLPETVSIPNPCHPDDRSQDIPIDSVILNTVKISGVIGYYVGANVLLTSSNVDTLPNQLSYATVGGVTLLENEDFIILDNEDDPLPNIKVEVQDFEVTSDGKNDNGEHYYLLTGKFKIYPVTI